MGSLLQIAGGHARPLVLGLVILVALGLMSDDRGTGLRGTDGFACHGFTDSPGLNRTLCQFHPARIWNMPLGEVFPFLSSSGNETPKPTAATTPL